MNKKNKNIFFIFRYNQLLKKKQKIKIFKKNGKNT